MSKELLRAWMKTKRISMNREDVAQLSHIIQQRLLAEINWQNIKTVSCYQSIESLNEVKTDEIIAYIAENHPDLKLSLQPQNENELEKIQFDLIIVPTLAFDSEGYRLGWGGGHYDRFLAGQRHALKVGLCFRSGYSRKLLPKEAHDIPLDKVITEV